LDSILKKEYRKLLRYTRRQLGEIKSIDAEDILHEVAFNVYSKIDIDSVVENVAAYLFRSIKNKVTDIFRKPTKMVSLQSFEGVDGSKMFLESIKNDDQLIDEIIEKEELINQLHQALQTLPPEYREILVATDFEGKTIKELSEEWDIPLGTLLSRRHRALSRLQKIMENYDII